jgi:hypothetical protein
VSIGVHRWYLTRIIAAYLRLRFDPSRFRKAAALIAIFGLFSCAGGTVETPSGEWRTYGGEGDILWKISHGMTPDSIRNSPALKGINIPRTGRFGIFGVCW